VRASGSGNQANSSITMKFMNACVDEEFGWIRTGREEFLPRDDPNWKSFISNLIPKNFEGYAKILHGIEAGYENIDKPLSNSEIALLKIPPCTKLWEFVEKLRREGKGPRIRWKTLAQLMGVPFAPEICHEWYRKRMEEPGCWPRFLKGPSDGDLDSEELVGVISALEPFTGNQDCFFRFSEISFIGTDKPILFRGQLNDLPSFLADGKYQFTPEYWWPTDHSWCLCSDYDLTFTIVGGPKELVSALLKADNLETLEVTSWTRVDDLAPIP
jgi:hypothetical protein